MHMADALVSPLIGGTMWGVSAVMIGYSSHQVKKNLDDRTVPLMGVLGAFVFAAQMINFTIPATGSSGHLGGGLLLAILLGPSAAFLTIASILTVQALFFADGGLLALGCNIFNMGFLPCMIAYPLIYRPITRTRSSPAGIFIGAFLAAIAGLQLGSLAVVAQTLLSGITDLSLQSFILFMQPIHLAIGVAEGFATASIVLFIRTARPDILDFTEDAGKSRMLPIRKPLFMFLCAALGTGCFLSLFASNLPDGLEWSLAKTAGNENMATPGDAMHNALASVQQKTAFLPDYAFRESEQPNNSGHTSPAETFADGYPTSLAGFVGSMVTLLFATLVGLLFKRKKVPFGNSSQWRNR